MEVFSPHEDLVYLTIGIYGIVLIISYLMALRLDINGTRNQANILSIESEEYESGADPESSITSIRYKANIEFMDAIEKLIQIKIPIAPRYLKDKNRKTIPIIYPKNKPQKARIDDRLYIYVIPLVLFTLAVLAGLIGAYFYIFGV